MESVSDLISLIAFLVFETTRLSFLQFQLVISWPIRPSCFVIDYFYKSNKIIRLKYDVSISAIHVRQAPSFILARTFFIDLKSSSNRKSNWNSFSQIFSLIVRLIWSNSTLESVRLQILKSAVCSRDGLQTSSQKTSSYIVF